MRSVWFAPILVLAAGCQQVIDPLQEGPVPQDVVLTALHGTGDTITVTLSNRSSGDVGYNLCPSRLEQRSGSSWVHVPPVPERVCTMELRLLPPGQAASARLVYVRPLPQGEYRVTTGVELPGGSWTTVRSNSFTVN
jgi:hypothetical protein